MHSVFCMCVMFKGVELTGLNMDFASCAVFSVLHGKLHLPLAR